MAGNEGSEGDARTRDADPEDNVIRFPRDWFGPLEDLVPIGPRAASAGVVEPGRVGAAEAEGGLPGAEVAPSTSGTEAPTEEPATPRVLPDPPPPNADDFWGERSAAIHQFVEAPDVGRVTAPRGGRAAISLPYVRAVAVLAAVAAVVTALAALGDGSGPGRAAGVRAALGSPSAAVGAARDRRPTPLIRFATAATRGAHHRSRARHTVRSATEHQALPAQSSSPSSGAAELTPVSDAQSGTSSGASSYSSGSSSSSGAAAAGPVGPGAAFAPGQMG